MTDPTLLFNTATEDPDIIVFARDQKRIAALAEKSTRDYRPRLEAKSPPARASLSQK